MIFWASHYKYLLLLLLFVCTDGESQFVWSMVTGNGDSMVYIVAFNKTNLWVYYCRTVGFHQIIVVMNDVKRHAYSIFKGKIR